MHCTLEPPPKILYRLLIGGHWSAGTTLICIFYTLYTSCCMLQLDGYRISSKTLAVSCSGSLLSRYTACVTACLLCICLQFMCILTPGHVSSVPLPLRGFAVVLTESLSYLLVSLWTLTQLTEKHRACSPLLTPTLWPCSRQKHVTSKYWEKTRSCVLISYWKVVSVTCFSMSLLQWIRWIASI